MVVTVLLGACTNDDRTVALPEIPEQSSVTVFDVPQGAPPKVDLLFVIDNSPAMEPHEARLLAELPPLVEGLHHTGRGDWHLGVVTSDLGGPGCSAAGDDGVMRGDGLVGSPYVIDWLHADQTITANYEGTMGEAFARIADVGHAGCATQRPLDAIRRAMENPRNFGFRRPEASLVVVVVAARDDAMTSSIEDHAAYVRGLGESHMVFFAAIVDGAAPRFEAVIAGLPEQRGTSTQLVGGAFDRAMPRSFSHSYSNHELCLEGELLDADPDAPGAQYDCSLADALVENGVVVHERVLPACDAQVTNKPCWQISAARPWFCFTELNPMSVKIERRDFAERGTHVIGHCVTE